MSDEESSSEESSDDEEEKDWRQWCGQLAKLVDEAKRNGTWDKLKAAFPTTRDLAGELTFAKTCAEVQQVVMSPTAPTLIELQAAIEGAQQYRLDYSVRRAETAARQFVVRPTALKDLVGPKYGIRLEKEGEASDEGVEETKGPDSYASPASELSHLEALDMAKDYQGMPVDLPSWFPKSFLTLATRLIQVVSTLWPTSADIAEKGDVAEVEAAIKTLHVLPDPEVGVRNVAWWAMYAAFDDTLRREVDKGKIPPPCQDPLLCQPSRLPSPDLVQARARSLNARAELMGVWFPRDLRQRWLFQPVNIGESTIPIPTLPFWSASTVCFALRTATGNITKMTKSPLLERGRFLSLVPNVPPVVHAVKPTRFRSEARVLLPLVNLSESDGVALLPSRDGRKAVAYDTCHLSTDTRPPPSQAAVVSVDTRLYQSLVQAPDNLQSRFLEGMLCRDRTVAAKVVGEAISATRRVAGATVLGPWPDRPQRTVDLSVRTGSLLVLSPKLSRKRADAVVEYFSANPVHAMLLASLAMYSLELTPYGGHPHMRVDSALKQLAPPTATLHVAAVSASTSLSRPPTIPDPALTAPVWVSVFHVPSDTSKATQQTLQHHLHAMRSFVWRIPVSMVLFTNGPSSDVGVDLARVYGSTLLSKYKKFKAFRRRVSRVWASHVLPSIARLPSVPFQSRPTRPSFTLTSTCLWLFTFDANLHRLLNREILSLYPSVGLDVPYEERLLATVAVPGLVLNPMS